MYCFFFFFKQKTAYEMRISDWSSDVCSSDLLQLERELRHPLLDAQADRMVGLGRHVGKQLREPLDDALGNAFVEPREADDRVRIVMHHLVDQMLVEIERLRSPLDRGVEQRLMPDRKSVVSGKSMSDRVDLGGHRRLKTTNHNNNNRSTKY